MVQEQEATAATHSQLMANIDIPNAVPSPPPPPPPHIKRAKSSRFSLLLENSVDYTSYRTAYGRQLLLQQQPKFDSIEDAEEELKCVLHDPTFAQTNGSKGRGETGSVMAENVALAVDWFIGALVLLFDGDEPFQNPDFLRLCCMFFASPLYENNTRLVQRHLVKRTYAELNTNDPHAYKDTLWLLLALLHLITEFQPDTYGLCRDAGLFPLLGRAVAGAPEKHLHVLAMSLMFEVAQAVALSSTDIDCITDELLLFLLDYVERMRYAESDVYNNTGTKLVLAMNEQFLRLSGHVSASQSLIAFSDSKPAQRGVSGRPTSILSAHSLPTLSPISSPSLLPASPDTQPLSPASNTASTTGAASAASAVNLQSDACAAPGCLSSQPQPQVLHSSLRHPALHALPIEAYPISRSRSMDLRLPVDADSSGLLKSISEMRGQKMQRRGSHSKARTSIDSISTLGMHMAPASTPVVGLLARRADCCKTFTENLVFLLNRETDPSTQILILHMLHCILTDPGTADILYTNDMLVLIDIVIRDLGNLSDALQRLRQAYLLVVTAILRNPVYLSTRHRLSDIELCLVNLLRHSLVCTQEPSTPTAAATEREEPASSGATRPASRRLSSSTAVSTPRMSAAEEDLAVSSAPISRPRRSSGAASPASSISSSVSEETCCLRPSDGHHSQHLPPQPKGSRRPAPPPPPRPTSSSSSSSVPRHYKPHVQARMPPPVPHRPVSRRRPPPPPPPQNGSVAQCSSSTAEHRETNTMRTHRRRAPPPPPPPPPPPRSSTPISPPAPSPRASTSHRAPPPPPTLLPRSTSRVQNPEAVATENTHESPPKPPRRRKPTLSGLRRQLSVKSSVSRYKRSGRAVPPPPNPEEGATDRPSAVDKVADDELGSVHDAGTHTKHPVSPIAESFAESPPKHTEPSPPLPSAAAHSTNAEVGAGEAGSDSDDDDGHLDSDAESVQVGMGDSADERRATRKLVENALRCCHEARIAAVSRSAAH